MLRDVARLTLLACVAVALVALYAIARIWQQGEIDEARPAGAIVVLGAAQYDGRPSQVFRARLDHAAQLYRDGYAPYLVVTGGKRPGDRTTEAAVARAYAMSLNVPADRILVEDEARTTLESVVRVARILRARGVNDAIFVSDPTHMLRVLRMARDESIVAYGSPTRTSPIDHDVGSRWGATAHELGALAFYFLTGGAPENELAEEDSGA
jgi:uncharacterized SAM-binding protein YcdF (DUF218 family)